ncbi:hypothetical protein BLNAU_9401 [Blattamonas nauphoetae]|uniref:Uncharacterized protein n=1 Tax=Blattamonas nauphoetae TaxID=2049346 RepID=A0ABQ9XW66_9EUKA|nr:hypothetical protein BLNAU_9401 [Blattamonas nauphoetae]
MVVNQKRRKTKTQLLNQTKWNRIRSVRLPNTLPGLRLSPQSTLSPLLFIQTPHTTLLVTPTTNVQSPPHFDAEWHSYSHSPLVHPKEMKTRTIKLVTLNPTRIVDNAQSELIVVFFPPLCSTGLDETKRAPNAFEMSVVGFDEFSIEPLFVTAGEKSMLLNSHLKTTRMSVGEEVEEGREEEEDQLE